MMKQKRFEIESKYSINDMAYEILLLDNYTTLNVSVMAVSPSAKLTTWMFLLIVRVNGWKLKYGERFHELHNIWQFNVKVHLRYVCITYDYVLVATPPTSKRGSDLYVTVLPMQGSDDLT